MTADQQAIDLFSKVFGVDTSEMRPTPMLRWLTENHGSYLIPTIVSPTLQQLWRSTDGQEQWRDVPMEKKP